MKSVESRSYSIYSLDDIVNDPDLYPEFKEIYKEEIERFLKEEGKNWRDLESHWYGRDAFVRRLNTFIFNKHGNPVFGVVDTLSFNIAFDEIMDWIEDDDRTEVTIRKVIPKDKDEFLKFIMKHWKEYNLSIEELSEALIEQRLKEIGGNNATRTKKSRTT